MLVQTILHLMDLSRAPARGSGLSMELFVLFVHREAATRTVGNGGIQVWLPPPYTPDIITSTLEDAFGDHFMHLPADIPFVQRALGSLFLDVLLFADLGMDVTVDLLAFSRLAPVQVSSVALLPALCEVYGWTCFNLGSKHHLRRRLGGAIP